MLRSSSSLSLLMIELLDLLVCFLLLHGGFPAPLGSLPGRAGSLAPRMPGVGGHGQASWARGGTGTKVCSTRFMSRFEPRSRSSRWMAADHQQTLEKKTMATPVFLVPGVSEPCQVQVLARAGRRQARAGARPRERPGPGIPRENGAFPPRGRRGGRPPTAQSSEAVILGRIT